MDGDLTFSAIKRKEQNEKKKKKKIVLLLLVCKYYKSYMRCLVMSKQRNKDLDLMYGPILASKFLTLFR